MDSRKTLSFSPEETSAPSPPVFPQALGDHLAKEGDVEYNRGQNVTNPREGALSMTKKELAQLAVEALKQEYPGAVCSLEYQDPLQLLIATRLSAQCTDKRVNMTTPAFYERFPTPKELALATEEEIFGYIKSISYPNNKTKNLHKMAQQLEENFGGKVPETVEELMTLAGVGRKTANVVVSVAYGQSAMAVDTHVFRVSARIGLTVGAKNPLQTEKQLVQHIPEELIPIAHHWLILHGRYVCTARKPKCDACGIRPWCKTGNLTKGKETDSGEKEPRKKNRTNKKIKEPEQV